MMKKESIKGFYLHYRDIYRPHLSNGADRKVAAQIKALRDAGLGCEFLFYPQSDSVPGMVKASLPGFSDGVKWPDGQTLGQADYLYFRRPRIISKELIRVMKEYKERNPKGIILFEIPTYPYDPEWLNPKMYLALRKDRRNRKRLAQYVDKIVDLSGNEQLFGVPTLQIINGIDFERIQPKKPVSDVSEINVLCAAYFTDVHGVDRMIEGLGRYYATVPERIVRVHIAGNGSVMGELKGLVRKHGIEDYVVFHGLLDSDELDALYDKCSMAVGVLGLHRYRRETVSSLKTREYLAKGIPFIYSGEEDVLSLHPVDFCLQIKASDEPVDIQQLIEFHDNLYLESSQEELIAKIRAYGEKYVSMDRAMAEVIDYLKLRLSE